MRIIAGKYRGRLLTTGDDLSVRPTTDRVKQTIFDILSARIEFEGIAVLDLFAGSGSLGLEALSRGASNATFVEKAKKSLILAERNIKTLSCEPQSKLYQADVFWYLKNTRQSFDLVFADPPYKLEIIGTIPERVFESSVLKENSYLVMEHSKGTSPELDPSRYEVTRKQFGQTVVLILKKLAQH